MTLVATVLGVVITAYSQAASGSLASDIDWVLFAGKVLWRGDNPYQVIGYTSEWPSDVPFLYPLAAPLGIWPLAAFPVPIGRLLFVAAGMVVLTWGITRDGFARAPVLLSAATINSLQGAQWSPLVVGAALLGWGWFLPLKPTMGLSLVMGTDRPRLLLIAGLSAAGLAVLSFLLVPSWLTDWYRATGMAPYVIAPVQTVSGCLLAIPLLFRWRRPEALLVLGYLLLPHTPTAYEWLPLALVTTTRMEALTYSLLTYVGFVVLGVTITRVEDPASLATMIGNLFIVLPLVWMIWRRENAGGSLLAVAASYVRRRGRHRDGSEIP